MDWQTSRIRKRPCARVYMKANICVDEALFKRYKEALGQLNTGCCLKHVCLSVQLMEAAELICDLEITRFAMGKNLEIIRIMFANDHKSTHLSYFGFHSKYIYIFSVMKKTELK